MSENRNWLGDLIKLIANFLKSNPKLSLHPYKVFIKTINSGVNFLGWINFRDHRVLRTVTRRRMFRKLANNNQPEVTNSYLGLLNHGNAYKLKQKLNQDFILDTKY